MTQSLQEARRQIAALDLQPYVSMAMKNGKLRLRDSIIAEAEYRHFLLLLFVNTSMKSTEWLVPTERADQVWHEHLLDSPSYRKCCDDIFGQYIDHHPGLEKGSTHFNKAMEHTKTVHTSLGGRDSGFVPTIFASCGASRPSSQASQSTPQSHDSTPSTSKPSSSGNGGHGASCGGGAPSCGGGGCGGGG